MIEGVTREEFEYVQGLLKSKDIDGLADYLTTARLSGKKTYAPDPKPVKKPKKGKK